MAVILPAEQLEAALPVIPALRHPVRGRLRRGVALAKAAAAGTHKLNEISVWKKNRLFELILFE